MQKNFFKNRRKLKKLGYIKAEVFFQDELRHKIPCGFRRVFVKEGRKWAYIITPGGRGRMRISEWRLMKPRYL